MVSTPGLGEFEAAASCILASFLTCYHYSETLHAYTHKHTHMHTKACVYVKACLSVCLSVCMYECMYVCMYIHTCMHTCMHTYVHMYLHIYNIYILCVCVCMCIYIQIHVYVFVNFPCFSGSVLVWIVTDCIILCSGPSFKDDGLALPGAWAHG